MIFHKLNKNNFEFFTIVTQPAKTFISGSGKGVTGSMRLFNELSDVEYDIRPNDADLMAQAFDVG